MSPPSQSDGLRVAVPMEPTRKQLLAGQRELDLWSDDELAQTIDGYEMAAKVYKAMTSAGD